MGKLARLVIHNTATPEGREVTVKDIRQWHIKENGWRQVGYADLIHLDGTITNLVPYDSDDQVDPWEITNGARGFNGTSRHIVFAGGCDRDMDPKNTITDPQWATLASYCKEFHYQHPDAKIVGHRDLDPRNKPHCPGFDVAEFLEIIGIPEAKL